MKILQNPVAVSVLGLVAAGLLFKTTVFPMVKRSRWYLTRGSHAAVAPAAPVKAVAPSVTNVLKGNPGANRPAGASRMRDGAPVLPVDIDMPAVLAGAVQWMQTPRRDPFKSR